MTKSYHSAFILIHWFHKLLLLNTLHPSLLHFFPLYKIKGGSLHPSALPAQCTAIYWCPDLPAISWTTFIPLCAISFLDETEVQKVVSSQFQSWIAIAGSLGSKPTLANTLTSSNQAPIVSLSCLCYGFLSLSIDQHLIKPCHQSYFGTPPLKWFGISLSLM